MRISLRSFGVKLLLLLVLVVAAAQLGTFLIVSRANRAEARRQIASDLIMAAGEFHRVVAYRNDILATGASSAAGDYAYKPLFANPASDPATLVSALHSVRLRIHADVATLLTTEGNTLACTAGIAPGSDVLRRFVAAADADPSPSPRAAGYHYLDHELYSLVIVPVRAPDIVAWLAVGFRIDDALARWLKDLTRIEVSFVDQEGQLLATTLAPTTAAALAETLPTLGRHTEMVTLPLAGESALVTTRRLPAGEHAATLALQFSLDEKLRPALTTERLLLVVGCGSLAFAALLSLAFARQLSRPIEALAAHTRVIAAGDYAARLTWDRSDELGRLADSLDAMSEGLAERDRVRDLLDKNVSPAIAAQLLREGAALGGEEREVTILFADLRGFTALSERLAPHELLALLNRYLDRMSRPIEQQGGIIDKFIGDAVMALFGAPVATSHPAAQAVTAALAMQRALAELNVELLAEGQPALALGIGINTARVVAGNIGSSRRLNYSVIGDGVNVAARLQSLTRTADYHTDIIASAATVTRCAEAARERGPAAPADFIARPLGHAAIRGRHEPVEIFAIEPTALRVSSFAG
ncbi:adenylate/guanylate cyclase domain-containing protein [Opitutus terrae]|uniref:Adenylate/guanylate cyclase with integral membrane sensor n=1 Tax=Opitutus terrae (strain DSM 11246 / JCM 15787 / PB90-1) TaxID=452637 RepID=B1ZMB6_OPITP|nr:adenylate/guanylate cyclase domain-containing protein [Opitutus terrae]ACB73369.1 adenylate/guanylate cyclase with integral membrane sensor [Opitutus terrae PB90-1]